MHNIDFLPAEYRQKHARRQAQPWQVVVAAATIALMVVAALAQHYRQHALQTDLAAFTPAYDAAIDLQNHLAGTQKRWNSGQACAELYTYLRHPWPRTQLLRALMSSLPESITLQQIQILREAPPTRSPAEIPPPVDRKTEEERLKSLTPAQRDLAQLTGRMDRLRTAVVLTGLATDIAALHRYIAELDATDIFQEADLDSFNRIDNGQDGPVLQFRAVLAVQPGYGQPGGPIGTRGQRSGNRDQVSNSTYPVVLTSER